MAWTKSKVYQAGAPFDPAARSGERTAFVHRLKAMALIILWCWAGGCATQEARDPPLPSLRDIRSKPVIPTLAKLSNLDAGTRPIIHISRIHLPLATSLDQAWSHVDEQVVSTLMRGAWQANGLRIGLLNADKADGFFRALSADSTSSYVRIAMTEHAMPICHSSHLAHPVLVDLTVPPWAVRELHVSGGRMQLLLQMVLDAGPTPGKEPASDASISQPQTLRWKLTPHHRLAQASLLPRTSLDKQLDGQVFDDLEVQVDQSGEQLLVLGLYWPWPKTTEDAAGRTTGTDDATKPVESAGDTEDDSIEPIDDLADLPLQVSAPPLPNHVGRSLFAGRRVGQPVQMLLLLTIESRQPTNAARTSSQPAAE